MEILKNIESIRNDFPILNTKVNGNQLIYFDNAATSQTPNCVINSISDYYKNLNSNIHRGVHKLSQLATEKYEESRKKFKEHFNARSTSEIIFTSGTTHSINLISNGFTEFVNQGDEIIVSCVGFPTTIAPIVQNGLKPVFVDIDFSDLNWDVNEIEDKITTKTRALFSSPVLGNPYDYDIVLDICDRNRILMIADNCDSLGTKWRGKYLTDNAVASSCSFYPAHHICTGEGGMISADDDELISIARSLSWWGRDCYCVGQQNLLSCGVCGKRFSKWIKKYDGIIDHKYVYSQMGYNLKPMDFQGAIGSVQMEKQDEIHQLRRKNKLLVQEHFEKIPGVRSVGELPEAETSWFGVPIICCLLYTSPSPRDLSTSRMPSSA